MKIKKILLCLLGLIFLAMIIISVINIFKWSNEKKHINTEVNNIKTEVIKKDNSINFNKLLSINSDTVAWLKVNNTFIDYPVVKTNNNEYYLNHSFYKKKNDAGWLFMDYRNKLDGSDQNIIIYGHNRLDGIMFGSLKDILNKEWYTNKDNLDIELFSKDGSVKYRIFSIYKIKEESYYLESGFTDSEYKDFINTLKSRSIYKFDTNISSTKQILTLSTCSGVDNYRLVVHAKKEF